MRLIDATKVERKVEQFLQYRYEDYGTMFGPGLEILNIIRNAPTIAPPPNAPLTLDELREMDGEPVWVTSVNNGRGRSWTLVDTKYEICREVHGGLAVFENYGKTWLAYRRKPEEGTK